MNKPLGSPKACAMMGAEKGLLIADGLRLQCPKEFHLFLDDPTESGRKDRSEWRSTFMGKKDRKKTNCTAFRERER
jgi:hypothetical protein